MNKVMKSGLGLIGLMLIFILTACTSGNATNNVSTQTQTTADLSQAYTLSEVQAHSSQADCWTAIDGKVYDLTSFIASGQHKPVIADACGIDASSLFSGQNKHSQPKAQSQLLSMVIGVLK